MSEAIEKARVYKRGPVNWSWHHVCPERVPGASGGLHDTHQGAFWAAVRHMKRCTA